MLLISCVTEENLDHFDPIEAIQFTEFSKFVLKLWDVEFEIPYLQVDWLCRYNYSELLHSRHIHTSTWAA